MKRLTLYGLIVSLAAVALLLGGCGGSYQARSVDLKNSLLVNPDILKEGTGDQALYRYQNPAVNVADYTAVLIDPVIISKQAELSAGELENYQTLANNFYVYMNQEMGKYLAIATSPGPGTMRIQGAIIDADNSKPVRTILSFTPIGIGLNLIKYSATGKQTAVGEITSRTQDHRRPDRPVDRRGTGPAGRAARTRQTSPTPGPTPTMPSSTGPRGWRLSSARQKSCRAA